RRRHTRYWRDWSSDVCSSDLDYRLLNTPAVPLTMCEICKHLTASCNFFGLSSHSFVDTEKRIPMNNSLRMPFYARTALIFIVVFMLALVMYVGQEIIIPILYAGMIAILLNPLVDYLISKGFNKILAILTVVLMAIVALLIA